MSFLQERKIIIEYLLLELNSGFLPGDLTFYSRRQSLPKANFIREFLKIKDKDCF